VTKGHRVCPICKRIIKKGEDIYDHYAKHGSGFIKPFKMGPPKKYRLEGKSKKP